METTHTAHSVRTFRHPRPVCMRSRSHLAHPLEYDRESLHARPPRPMGFLCLLRSRRAPPTVSSKRPRCSVKRPRRLLYAGRHLRLGFDVALKVPKGKQARSIARRELLALRELHHPNSVSAARCRTTRTECTQAALSRPFAPPRLDASATPASPSSPPRGASDQDHPPGAWSPPRSPSPRDRSRRHPAGQRPGRRSRGDYRSSGSYRLQRGHVRGDRVHRTRPPDRLRHAVLHRPGSRSRRWGDGAE